MSALLSEPAAGGGIEPGSVELILSQIDSLPTLPAAATQLLALTGDDTASLRQVVQLIESDQSLSARLLALANRASVGGKAGTVERAVVMLGFRTVRCLVLSMQIFETFAHKIEPAPSQLDRAGLWKHCLAVGCAARLLAEEANQTQPNTSKRSINPEEAFVCGLLHDIGKVALNACFPRSHDRAIAAAEASRGCIADAERQVFGIDHALAGRRLAARWKLPTMIGECIWLHHHTPASTPGRIENPHLVHVVQLADRLVRQMRIGYSGNYTFDEPLEKLAEAIGLSAKAIQHVRAALPEQIAERAELLGLDRISSKEIYQEALVDANSELAQVNAELSQANRRLEERSRSLEALCILNARPGEDASHEEVCRAAAEAAGVITPGRPVAVLACSAARGICSIAALAGGASNVRSEVLTMPRGVDFQRLSEARGSWLPASVLPAYLLDRLAALLETPPAWCRPIHCQSRLMGALVVSGDPGLDPDESFSALADGIGRWMQAAESAAAAWHLNEELAEMNRRLVASQAEIARLRSLGMVGEMAAGAAHELNNPLAVISGRAQLLNRDGVADDVRQSAAIIIEHAHRASRIVTELMEFAKPAPPEPTNWPVRELLADLRSEVLEKNLLTPSQFQLEVSDDLPQIRADAAQMKMLFDEVIRNSIEAMRGVTAPLLVVNCFVDPADERAVISIQDNGCGMTPEVMERAMDPFFSSRPAGRGRGLGLSRAARYAEINGGRIRLANGAGEGTVVFVELPTA